LRYQRAVAETSRFIPGLHYFCDHRCWHCPLANRCAVNARWVASPESRKKPRCPAARVDAVVALSLQVTLDDVAAAMAAVGLTRKVRPTQELIAADRELAAERAEIENDPLVARAREYTRQCWTVLQVIRPLLAARHDHDGRIAAEDAEELCVTVASKIFRAVSSSRDPDVPPVDVQSDANGSAKVALLVIEQSKRAWRILTMPHRGVANGTPSRFLATLEGLEHDLLALFPRASEFIRPGFDTGQLTGDEAGLAQAVRAPGRVRAN
jgi:hypothetical protein